jgi:tRNA threonylcarbamoyladenosine biosynthesis protein TsaB
MKILAIETSGPTFSLALAEKGSLVSEVFWHAGFTHSERLIPALQWILDRSSWNKIEIQKIAISIGPGSFTGIRVGLTCARTLAQGLGIPVVGIDTLEVITAGIPACGCHVVPAIDALRNEVYTRQAGKTNAEIVSIEDFCGNLRRLKGTVIVAGNAVETYGPYMKKILKSRVCFAPPQLRYPRAGVLALLANHKDGTDYAKVKPLYLRKSWAEERRT